jgi:phage virion morphogenesis protein
MAGALLKFALDTGPAEAALAEAKGKAQDLRPALRAIGRAGVNQARFRFQRGRAPDGTPWKKSRKLSGQTLILSGLLMRSMFAAEPEAKAVEWGSNRIYAAVHQFGATIKAKTSKGLRFRVGGNGAWVTKQSVTIPARPFLGVNREDEAQFAEIMVRHFGGPLGVEGGAA